MAFAAIDTMLRARAALGLFLVALAGCSSSSPPGVYKLGNPYQIEGRWYYPEYDPHYDRLGIASWYGEPFHGRRTANGERFDRDMVTAAHPTLPLPSLVRVVNLENRRQLVVRVNDRGPFIGDRIIDLSQEAARQLGFERQGLAQVRVQFVGLADAQGVPPQPTIRHARARAPEPRAEPAAQVVRLADAQGVPPRPTIRHARVQAPERPVEPAAQVVATAAPHCHGPFIQVGAFAEPARAQRLIAALHALQAMPVSLAAPAQDRLARVRLGPIPDPSTAHTTLDRLKQSGFSEAFIVAPEKALTTSC